MILFPGLCGYFALDNLLETRLKSAVFEIHVLRNKSQAKKEYKLTLQPKIASQLDNIIHIFCNLVVKPKNTQSKVSFCRGV